MSDLETTLKIQAGLTSAVRTSNLSIVVLAYNSTRVPVGCAVVEADRFLPRATFETLLEQGVPIQILADRIRLSYLKNTGMAWPRQGLLFASHLFSNDF